MQINKNVIRSSMLVAGGLMVGGGVGYMLGVNRTAKKYEAIIDNEVQSVKDAFRRGVTVNVTSQPFASPQEAAAILIPAEDVQGLLHEPPRPEDVAVAMDKIMEYQGAEELEDPEFVARLASGDLQESVVTENGQLKTVNVFDKPDRSDERPYLISVDEYMEDDEVEGETHDKLTITYWEGDDILMDEREQIIPDIEGTVGSVHLTMFGEETKKYSKDPNIVYVRNERIRADFEIVRDERSFSVIVLGMDPDIVEGNEKKPIKKMRPDG